MPAVSGARSLGTREEFRGQLTGLPGQPQGGIRGAEPESHKPTLDTPGCAGQPASVAL